MHPMAELKNRLRQILTVIPPSSEIVYVDYPVYNNGGDMLIMKGAEAFFRSNRIRVRARFNTMDFPDRMPLPEGTIIVCSGGGNFGDLYEHHQKLRERVVAQYPRNRVVILPQTIHFADERNYDRTAALFNAHPDLHLFVRDEGGYEKAKRKFSACRVYLCPDMAHQLWPIASTRRPEWRTLHFLRNDIESPGAGQHQQAEPGNAADDRLDWDTLFNRFERRVVREFQRMCRLDKRLGSRLPIAWLWAKYTDYLIGKTIDRFSGYGEIRTSRLHGHILACLMDKPHRVIDNSYGKNAAYYRTWTHRNGSAAMEARSAATVCVPGAKGTAG